jgi:hypothetical protein
MDYFKSFDSPITDDARCTPKLNPVLPYKSSIKHQEVSFQKQTGLKFKEESSKVLHLEFSVYGAETWTLRKVHQQQLESFQIWCWRGWRRSSGPIM